MGNSPSSLKVSLLLCDFAEVLNGKLYIMGGGWTQVLVPNHPVQMALAAYVLVPWTESNRPHHVVLRLVTADGQLFEVDGRPLRLDAKLEVGRPPGVPHGVPLEAPIAINFPALAFQPGRYRWEIEIDGNIEDEAAFWVREG